MNQKDEWVVLELNSRSEGEDPDTIAASIRSSVKGSEVFIPAAVTQIGEDRVVHHLVEGYAFIRRALPDAAYLRLENSRYVQAVLTEPGGFGKKRRLAVVRGSDIERMRGQIDRQVDQGIGVGDVVKITSGPYRNIDATVVEEIPEEGMVQVFVKLRSKQSIVTLPRSFLRVVDRAPLSPVYTRLAALRAWTRMAQPVFDWADDAAKPIQDKFRTIEQFESWLHKGRRLHAFVTFFYGSLDTRIAEIRARLGALQKFDDWARRARPLHTFVSMYYGFLDDKRASDLTGKLEHVQWFESVQDRIHRLGREVDDLSQEMPKHQKNGDKKVVQNILIDGFNLAFRCLYAPGMSELADARGRPTGVVLGFLRSLGSLRKRYPDATVHVVWDGSSQRRKVKFGEYKANRPQGNGASSENPSPVFSQIEFLRKVLPMLDVRQAINSVEEADDVIATLVRNDLSGQVNVIFSTDRDLLQLVNDTTMMLMPGVGARKEILFDKGEVERSFGVPPSQMVHLRALYGDASDNIPGVPRVPKKVLCSLLQAHRTIDGIYGSGLTGVTKAQYERLRSAEPQVRINADLMSLVDVPVSLTHPDADPDAAAEHLRSVDVNPDPILEVFFRKEKTAEA